MNLPTNAGLLYRWRGKKRQRLVLFKDQSLWEAKAADADYVYLGQFTFDAAALLAARRKLKAAGLVPKCVSERQSLGVTLEKKPRVRGEQTSRFDTMSPENAAVWAARILRHMQRIRADLGILDPDWDQPRTDRGKRRTPARRACVAAQSKKA